MANNTIVRTAAAMYVESASDFWGGEHVAE